MSLGSPVQGQGMDAERGMRGPYSERSGGRVDGTDAGRLVDA